MERDLRRRVTVIECETHHKVSQSNTFFFRLMSPGGGTEELLSMHILIRFQGNIFNAI